MAPPRVAARRSLLRRPWWVLALLLLGAPPAAQAEVDGAWGSFGNPRAVHARGVTYFGFVSSRGDVGVGAFDERTGRTRSTILAPRFDKDDHNNASLWVRPDGRIVAFWSPHSGHVLPRARESRLYYRISCAPRSIRCFGPTRTIGGNTGANQLGYTYPSPVYVRATRTLWLFWRGGDWQPTYARSRDGGLTWTRPKTLLSGGRKVYAVYAEDGGGGVHVALVPDNPSVGQNSIYYLRHSRGRWLRADGTVVGGSDPPVSLHAGDLVYRLGDDGGDTSWVLDVAEDASGHPVVLYRLFGGPDAGYWYAHWTGGAWTRTLVARSGLLGGAIRGYAVGASIGGATLDHEDPRVVYLSRVAGSHARIEVAVTADGGRSWQLHPVPQPASAWPNLRPVSPLGLRDRLTVLWMNGRYAGFRDYDTRVHVWTGRRAGDGFPGR